MTETRAEKQKVQVWVWCRTPSDTHPQVLLLKMRTDRGGYWQPVTGSVESQDVDLEAAALRETQEETALHPLRPPKALGYEFTFPSRWGGQCRETVFEVEVASVSGQCPPIKIDPAEHTEYRWLPVTEAKKLLHFESNVQPLILLQKSRWVASDKKPRDITEGLKAWLKKGIPVLAVFFAPWVFGGEAVAAQNATVISDSASVREKPKRGSTEVGTFAEGDSIQVSDQPVKDRAGQSWYKVRTSDGKFGFIPVSDIEMTALQRERTERGIDSLAADGGADPEGSGWTVTFRGLAMGGMEVFQKKTGSFAYDAEVTLNLGWGQRGYARRQWALGGAFTSSDALQFIAVSLVHRFYTDSRSEPEVRLRAGLLGTEAAGGLSLGVRFPFSLVSGAHLSGYAEVSAASSIRSYTLLTTAGAGLALHF